MKNEIKFFLGANSKNGFMSYFKQLQEQNNSVQLLILKGGPGSGKSSLMKRVLTFAREKGHETEIIPCASDPHSLDAFIDYTGGFSMMDGTAPHVQDPLLPGALHHIMYTGDLWDIKALNKNKDKISEISSEISSLHLGAGAYIKAAASLLWENVCYSAQFLDKKAVADFVNKVTLPLTGGDFRPVKTRLLSAVSVGETVVYEKTLSALADKIYVLDDTWGGAANAVLKQICSLGEARGESIIHCPCSVIPEKTDHVIFPERRLAFATKNSFLPVNTGEKIHCSMFYKPFPLSDCMRERLNSSKELITKAQNLVGEAKNVHDDLEAFYVDAMDFDKMIPLYKNILESFYL